MSNKKETMFVVLTGALALGIFAAAFGSSQMFSAMAQNDGDEQPPVTSMDDVNCEQDPSLVHCVDAQTGAPEEASLISAPYNHGYSGTPTVSTSGFATTKVKPDKFSVTAGVETNGTTAKEAADRNAEQMTKVIDALKALGISEDQLSTGYYSLYPVQDYRYPPDACIMIYPPPPECQPKNQITGYRASNSVTATLDAAGSIGAGEVIDAAIAAGANNVNGVYFFVSQEMQQEIRDGLIAEAIANARHRADIAADAVGMDITGVHSINLADVYFPAFGRGFDASVAEAAPTPILPGEQEITSTVNVVFTIGSGNATSEENSDAADEAVATARQFILSKLPSLGIEIDDELDLHTDMLVHVSENEFHLDYSVLDTNGQSHDGHIEVVNGEVTVAELDGNSIL